tara:strand:- start:2515 stop:2748 length:234 start_codon:yes stop_codon:yes gene_type:complete
MFNIGDLVYHKRNDISFGLGVVMKISDRTAGPDNPKVLVYQIHFAKAKFKHGFNDSIPRRWILEQDIELVSEAKTNE